MVMSEIARKGATDVAQYDPERELKTIAVAEAAEKYFRRVLKNALRDAKASPHDKTLLQGTN